MSKTIEMIKNYVPYNAQEEKDKQFFIDCEHKDQILTRENEMVHLTSACFVTNKARNKILCIYHNIYKSWTWIGGHADGVDDMLYVAEKELREETFLKNFRVLLSTPITIESVPVHGHYKRGKYVSAHIHLNVTYLFEANEEDEVKIKPDENSNVAWLTFSELMETTKEQHMIPIYNKIIEKIKGLNL